MKKCCESCVKHRVPCPVKKCRYWIKHKEDLNCTFISVEKNGPMTLREVAERLGISFVRIKQIQDVAQEKLISKDFDIKLLYDSE
jgi:predicted transcriptional regulator|tara:strand:- start:106 stop:360 length:255 start_codon:yes stop_codon:yes gene_type:complete